MSIISSLIQSLFRKSVQHDYCGILLCRYEHFLILLLTNWICFFAERILLINYRDRGRKIEQLKYEGNTYPVKRRRIRWNFEEFWRQFFDGVFREDKDRCSTTLKSMKIIYFPLLYNTALHPAGNKNILKQKWFFLSVDSLLDSRGQLKATVFTFEFTK